MKTSDDPITTRIRAFKKARFVKRVDNMRSLSGQKLHAGEMVIPMRFQRLRNGLWVDEKGYLYYDV